MTLIQESHRQRWAGRTMKDSAPDTGRVAKQLGVTARSIRRYKEGHESAPLNRYLEWLAKVDKPWREAAHVQSFVKLLTIRHLPTAELVERWWALCEMEHALEAEENGCIQRGGDPVAEIMADEREAAIQLERAAVRRELHERNVDPRDYGRKA